MKNPRYQYQYALPNWGEAGQTRIGNSHVVVVGAGGLGSNIVPMLARIGVGQITIIDDDRVELSNLHRQTFTNNDARSGVYKVQALAELCRSIDPDVIVNPLIDRLNDKNIHGHLGLADLILDGLDNWETRYLINDYAIKRGKPYVYGAVSGLMGMVKTILPKTKDGNTPWEQAGVITADLRKTFGYLHEKQGSKPRHPAKALNDLPGVLAPALPIVANLEVIEAMKILTGNYEAVNRNLVSLNAWKSEWRPVAVNVE